jgi:hypothetical protein
MKNKWIAIMMVLGLAKLSALAQWTTQTVTLKPGWNAIFLHVNASYANIGDLPGLDSNIEEIWLWKPQTSAGQFIDSPDAPTNRRTRWASWLKNLGPSSTLQRLIGNTAYLVRYGSPDAAGNWTPAVDLTWNIKGRPVPPSYNWTSSGLNLIGFSSHPSTAPSLEQYFPQAIRNDLQFFGYKGGALGETNPRQVFALRSTATRRGEAFWVRSKGGQFNNYFAPYDLVLQNYSGVNFGETRGQYRVIIRNRTDRGLVVTLNLNSSEIAPHGQQAYDDGIKLMVRGAPNPGTLTYSHQSLHAGAVRITLTAAGKPGSSEEVILGLNRTGLTGASGSQHGSVLEFTDSLGHSQVQIPVRATKGSNVGLWVGDARIKEVRHDLTFFAKNPYTKGIMLDAEGKASIQERDDSYGPVSNPFPLRLIFHQGTNSVGTLNLYQSIFHGLQKGADLAVATPILSSDEDSLESSELESARRITALHLPWRPKGMPWAGTGEIKAGTEAVVQVGVTHNDHSSNPFLHTYHPDHDNLNNDIPAFKKELPQGSESFEITRDINLKFNDPPTDFDGLTRIQRRIAGSYNEIITIAGAGTEKIHYYTRGSFLLNRISTIDKIISSER